MREGVHDGYAGGDLRPEIVNESVEIGECVKLEHGMALVQHR